MTKSAYSIMKPLLKAVFHSYREKEEKIEEKTSALYMSFGLRFSFCFRMSPGSNFINVHVGYSYQSSQKFF